MSKHRKCDTTKYKKRRTKERVAHTIRTKREKEEEIVQGRILDMRLKTIRLREERKRPLAQKMVNLLAKNVCERDNRYYGAMAVRQLLEISSLFHVNPMPHFPSLLEPPRERAIESDKVIDGEVTR